MHAAPNPGYPPKHQFSIVLEIDAPIERCYRAGAAEEDMMAWVINPKSVAYDHSAATEPYGPGSFRTVRLQNGMDIVEFILITEKPYRFGYYIPSLGSTADALMKNYQGRMNFEPLGPSRTRLTWNGYFDCPGWRRLFEPLVRATMRRMLGTMAGNLQRHLGSESKQKAA